MPDRATPRMGDAHDWPVLFSGAMVRAILEGRKTMNRRIVSPGTCQVLGSRVTAKSPAWAGLKLDRAVALTKSPASGGPRPHLAVPWVHPEDEARGMEADAIYRVDPIWSVGDQLWVKEDLGRRPASFLGIEATNGVESAFYRADDEDVLNEHEFNLCPWWKGKTLSGRFLPRARSRLTLLVTEVRVERLADISEADAVAEGVRQDRDGAGTFIGREGPGNLVTPWPTAREAFADIWDTIHGHTAFARSPWVVATTFRPVLANIDALPTPEAA